MQQKELIECVDIFIGCNVYNGNVWCHWREGNNDWWRPPVEGTFLFYRRLSCGFPLRHWLSCRCLPVQLHTEVLQEAEMLVPTCGMNFLDNALDWTIGALLLKWLTWAYKRLRCWCPPVETSLLSSVKFEFFVSTPVRLLTWILQEVELKHLSWVLLNLSFLCPPLWDCLPEFYRRLSCEAAFLQTEQSSCTSEHDNFIIVNSLCKSLHCAVINNIGIFIKTPAFHCIIWQV